MAMHASCAHVLAAGALVKWADPLSGASTWLKIYVLP
jgi:hypothetical protein